MVVLNRRIHSGNVSYYLDIRDRKWKMEDNIKKDFVFCSSTATG
jgi:hypothetical protein